MSEEPPPTSLSKPKDVSLRDRGYGAGDYPPLLPLPRNLKRGRPSPHAPRFPAKLGTLEIQRVLPKTGRGSPLVLVWGWPTPIRMNARTELPPLPLKPVHGPAARDEVRRIVREAKREGINFGWFTRMNLYALQAGDPPGGGLGIEAMNGPALWLSPLTAGKMRTVNAGGRVPMWSAYRRTAQARAAVSTWALAGRAPRPTLA